jgi:hypothetical protein
MNERSEGSSSGHCRHTSGRPLYADMRGRSPQVRFVPIGEVVAVLVRAVWRVPISGSGQGPTKR